MSDIIENNTEEETSGFGLGRGLDALFGEDEVMGLDEDETIEAPEINEGPAEEEITASETTKETDSITSEAENIEEQLDSIIENMETEIEEQEAQPVEEETSSSDDTEDALQPQETETVETNIENTAEAVDASKEENVPLQERKTLSEAAEANEETDAPSKGKKQHTIPIENLYPSPFQPRKIFRDESIDELASSIKQYGVLQPLLVRKDPSNDDGYEIIAGERRWRASQKAQIHELPVVLLDIDELEAYKIALIENLQREDIDPIDEANGYQKLLEDFGQTQEQLADAVGKSRPHITNTLRLLQLPVMAQAMLREKQISMGHARALIGVENAEDIVNKIMKQGLSVRQTEKLAANAKGQVQQKRPRAASPANEAAPEKDPDTIAIENDISNALGMNVSIDSADGKSGKISVEFKSLDQLDDVLHRLAHFPGTRLSG